MNGALCAVPALAVLAAALLLAARATRGARLARAETQRLRTQVAQHAAPRDALAHEIRTPLTLIRASAELLAEETPGDLNEVQRRFVATILDNAGQAIGMAEDFLTQARLEHQLFTLHLENVELRRLVRGLVQEMRRTVATPMRIEEHGAPVRMVADRRLLRQAVANTVTNAVRHAGEGTTVTISVSSEEDTALITVSDDGRGMTPQEREGLFTPFRSQNSLDAPASRGVGLGMTVTKQILTLHGGSILVDSMVQHGTAVYLTLPLRPPDATASGTSPSTAAAPPFPLPSAPAAPAPGRTAGSSSPAAVPPAAAARPSLSAEPTRHRKARPGPRHRKARPGPRHRRARSGGRHRRADPGPRRGSGGAAEGSQAAADPQFRRGPGRGMIYPGGTR